MLGTGKRTIVWCAAAFLAGNALGGAIFWGGTPIKFCFAAISALVPIILVVADRRHLEPMRWGAILAAFAMIGAWALLIGRAPPQRGTTAIETYALRTREMLSERIDSLFSSALARIPATDSANKDDWTGGTHITPATGSAKGDCGTESGGGAGSSDRSGAEANRDEIAVIKALCIGDKSDLDRQVKRNFRASGATHLLALSGLHVGIIYKLFGFLLAIFGAAPMVRRIRSALTIAFLWWFAIITGLSPSIFRAVLMITIHESGRLIGRRSDGLNSLATSAIIIVLLDPEAPRELSFQMSFCACLAIFTIYPKMNALMVTRIKPLEYIWNCACLAISCQMTTGIIAWAKFGTFPKYFLISNLLTVPLVGAIMYLIAAAIITVPFPQVSAFVIRHLIGATELLNLITETIAGISG